MNCKNQPIFIGNNLDIMRGLNSGIAGLIATDPPFNKEKRFTHTFGDETTEKGKKRPGFDDAWTLDDVKKEERQFLWDEYSKIYDLCMLAEKMHSKGMSTYLTMMATRLLECHRILAETRSMYLHCNHSANTCLRMLMDDAFGKDNFRNEIVWKRSFVKGTRGLRKAFGAITDTILYYGKSGNSQVVIPKTIPKVLPKFPHKDERGYYRAVTQLMADSKLLDSLHYEWNGLNPPYGWRVYKENLERLHKEGLIHFNSSRRLYRKQYASEYKGMDVGNLWDGASPASAKERTG